MLGDVITDEDKCIRDDMKAATRQSPNCLKIKK